MAHERRREDGESAPDRELSELEHEKEEQVLEREGLETELMEHDASEEGENIHHAG
jgi:hypothetical protein